MVRSPHEMSEPSKGVVGALSPLMSLPNGRVNILSSGVIVSCSSLYDQGWQEPECGLEEGSLGQDRLEDCEGNLTEQYLEGK